MAFYRKMVYAPMWFAGVTAAMYCICLYGVFFPTRAKECDVSVDAATSNLSRWQLAVWASDSAAAFCAVAGLLIIANANFASMRRLLEVSEDAVGPAAGAEAAAEEEEEEEAAAAAGAAGGEPAASAEPGAAASTFLDGVENKDVIRTAKAVARRYQFTALVYGGVASFGLAMHFTLAKDEPSPGLFVLVLAGAVAAGHHFGLRGQYSRFGREMARALPAHRGGPGLPGTRVSQRWHQGMVYYPWKMLGVWILLLLGVVDVVLAHAPSVASCPMSKLSRLSTLGAGGYLAIGLCAALGSAVTGASVLMSSVHLRMYVRYQHRVRGLLTKKRKRRRKAFRLMSQCFRTWASPAVHDDSGGDEDDDDDDDGGGGDDGDAADDSIV